MMRWSLLAVCVSCTVIGGVGGWIASQQAGPSSGAPGADERGGSHAHAPHLSPQTLKNLGVETSEVSLTTFTRTRDIPAVIERTSLTERPVFAPVGGRVREVRVEPGMVVAGGDVLITIVREPIPRPTLTLTADILEPAKESVHQTVVEVRNTREEIKILETELERVTRYTGQVGDEELPILPRQTAIDLKYRLLRARRSLDHAQHELEKHGFTDQQVKSIVGGGAIPNLGKDNWRHALERNGLWPPRADQLLEVLPAALRRLPWVIATIGELAASDLIGQDLVAWLQERPGDCGHFLEIGSLLQRGHSVADIRLLHDLDALDPIVEVRAPRLAAGAGWDVSMVDVKPGAHVSGGARLLTLLDPRIMHLATQPVGGEAADVLRAVEEGASCSARPLVPGAGPELDRVRLSFVSSARESGATAAYAKVVNTPLESPPDETGRRHRGWKLRAGLRYVLRVPLAELSGVLVLPSDAVTREGPRQVAFVWRDGEFEDVDVAILHRDADVVVVAGDETGIRPGDVVVQRGAYALGLALKGDTSGAGAHGHGHDH